MVRKHVKHRLFTVIWFICAGLATWIYYHWHVDRDYVGLAEIISHPAGARESGMVRDLMVDIRDRVRTGQIVAVLDMSDLDAELLHLQNRMEAALAVEDANRSRFAMEVQRLKLQVNNAGSTLIERLADIAARQAEFAGLTTEINRLQKAESAGLGHSRDLADLIVKRDSLHGYLQILEQDLDMFRAPYGVSPIRETGDGDGSLINAMMAEAREQTNDILREILIVENRKQLRTVVSPCDGQVVDILARPGDTIEAFLPILTIMESSTAYLNVYIPERTNFSVQEGMDMNVYPVRKDTPRTTGRVDFVHPGYTQVPERLTVRGRLIWARVARVNLDPGHGLLPGEIVHVRVFNNHRNRLFRTNGVYAKGSDGTRREGLSGKAGRCRRPVPADMTLPPELVAATRFEPSGLVWHPDTGRYIIASDDTGFAGTPSDHQPLLFFMDPAGKIDADAAEVAGTDTFNDLEAITQIDTNVFLAVSSQSASKRGKRPSDRRRIYTIRYREGRFVTESRILLTDVITASIEFGHLTGMDIPEMDDDGLPVVNIEGAAYKDGVLFLGLKEPVTDAGAIIWRLDGIDEMMTVRDPTRGRLSVYGRIVLGKTEGKPSGISDLAFDSRGRFWALSTIPNTDDSLQMGGLHRIDRFKDGRLEAETVFEFPGLKPEGLAFDDTGSFMIVFDSGPNTPVFLTGRCADL